MSPRSRFALLLFTVSLTTACGRDDAVEPPAQVEAPGVQEPSAAKATDGAAGELTALSTRAAEAARLAAESDAAISPLLARRADATPAERAENLAELARLDMEHDARLSNEGVIEALHEALMDWRELEPAPEVEVALGLLQHLNAGNSPAGLDGTLVPMMHAGKVEAILAAGRIGDPALFPMLEMAASMEGDTASAGQAALALLGVPGYTERLLAALASQDRATRLTAHDRLAYLGGERARLALEKCVASVGQSDAAERDHAALALASLSDGDGLPKGLSVAQQG